MRVAAIAAGAAVVIGGVVTYLVLQGGSGGRQQPVTGTTTAPTTTSAPAHPLRPVRPRAVETPWPEYGRDAGRTASASFSRVHPPYAVRWTIAGGSLIEFPPTISRGTLFFGTNHGRVLAVDAAGGRTLWTRAFDRCIAASPAVAGTTVYVSVMDPYPCSAEHDPAGGFVVALDASTGKELWRADVGVTESSPLVLGRTLYVGSWDGRLYALDRRTGRELWSFPTGGKIKGAAASHDGTLFFGSYDGRVYAVGAAGGSLRWSRALGGPIYANPAIAGNRLVVGDLSGTVSALRLDDGRLLWSTRTGRWVYSSAAFWKDTVYVGSYDGRLYALDASTGRVRWSFDAGSPISGTPTVVDGIVYFARCSACVAGQTHLDPRGSFGLDASSGRLVWRHPDGEYTPIVSDGRYAFLVGYSHLSALVPVR
jgi:outer membrane protein assembly factor BamB